MQVDKIPIQNYDQKINGLYRSNLKNRNLDKEIPQIQDPRQAALFIDRQRGADPEFEEKPTPSKTDSSGCFGILKVDLNALPLPAEFILRQQIMLYMPPMQIGGNHKHPQREIFLSLSDDVELHWIDKDGTTHTHKMKEGNQLFLFDVQPFVPHAIINLSKTAAAVILELTDTDEQHAELCPVLVNQRS